MTYYDLYEFYPCHIRLNTNLYNDYFSSIGNILKNTDYSLNEYKIYNHCYNKYQIPQNNTKNVWFKSIPAYQKEEEENNSTYGTDQNNIHKEKLKNEKELKNKSYKKSSAHGRKKKNDQTKREHDKFSPDNIINKIKTVIFNDYIITIIKINSIDEKTHQISLKKLKRTFINDLNNEKNKDLLDKSLKEILSEINISAKYTNFQENYNKKIIDKIYEEKTQKNIMKILELTLREILIIFRKRLNNEKNDELFKEKKLDEKIKGLKVDINDVIDFIENIKNNKNKENEVDIDDFIDSNELDRYVKEVKKYCLEYENWFDKRISRESKKKLKQNRAT